MKLSHSEDFYLRILFGKIKVREIMITPPIVIPEQESLSHVYSLFKQHGIGHLIVINEKMELAGVISQKYFYRAQSPKRVVGNKMLTSDTILDGDSYFNKESLDNLYLNNITNKQPLTLGPDDPIAKAVLKMSTQNVAFVPVVDVYNKVVGSISLKEIVDFSAHILKE